MHLRDMRIRMAALATAIALLPLAAVSATAGSAEPGETSPFVVEIHADWCGTCLFLASTWAQIERDLDDRARIVRFDVTDRARFERSRSEAQRLGLDDFFATHKGSTGVIAVLDGRTREPLMIRRGGNRPSRSIAKRSTGRSREPTPKRGRRDRGLPRPGDSAPPCGAIRRSQPRWQGRASSRCRPPTGGHRSPARSPPPSSHLRRGSVWAARGTSSGSYCPSPASRPA